jgi:hypothetical protein
MSLEAESLSGIRRRSNFSSVIDMIEPVIVAKMGILVSGISHLFLEKPARR